ncbi:PREDICTED: protein ENHANCED DOWNY MILDEW 2-like [Ipomoea nil]|uniref:protein ENHANCED DOWNY MILDEW 2-like n=1 Tax=Ipomoea nil TaxID=35883 RepID=UPI000900F081|nr:PREDICTED: protein ENHANCED DOWNY MILDEW 2-like [Ipomoea nil]XP_019155531.1 PREDICTED: protein ENHANCED DOWNY MILDEW 2-like [Ipomoea nil]
MASSDEEGEIVPECIIDYYFVDCNDQPVSFVLLPLGWDGSEVSMPSSAYLFVRGTADDGFQKVYKKAVAWKFRLCFLEPVIYVLLPRDNTWVKLLKPRKSYQEIIKPVLTVVHCLQFVKFNPQQSREAVWKHIVKTLSACEVLPCEDDLFKHISILRDTALRDKDISKSEYLAGFLSETSTESAYESRVNQANKRHKFIVDEDDDDSGGGDEGDGIFDHVCALCDNGGELLCCEGRCIRSFHPTIESGADSLCESLGYTSNRVEAIQTFICKNCQHGLHQCFACGLLGFSDSSSGAAEVFPCVSATCGHFFHPKCISRLVYPSDEIQAIKLEKEIANGEQFTCPAHKCFICNQVEDKKVNELQFAVCRRCPKAYHRKCLPRSITFENNFEQNIQQRAWDGLLPGRILIYCMKHKMIPEIGTPRRDHILFPFEARKDKQASGQLSSKETVLSQRRTKVFGAMREMVEGEGDKSFQRFPGDSIKEEGKPLKVASTLKMSQTVKTVNGNYMCIPKETYKPPNVEKRKFKEPVNIRLVSKGQNISQTRNVVKRVIVVKEDNSEWPSRDETEKSIRALVESVDSSFDKHKFMMEHKKNSIHTFSSKFDDVKTITEAKVERAVKAVQAALKKLDEGHSIEDAKAICEPEVLKNIFKWKKNLGSYLAPFLNGMRYTSFGRHFTKLDKLREIVNRLRWYVQDGDMVVDFCCGSNDFSCLMKEELQKMGKTCEFKNYDLIQPKNDFNFEKRNWLSVAVGELPEGSKLIMGLNPPFAHAYEFLRKALTFKPKVLIVTVPKDTTRLDGRQDGYDIVWEDHKILAGKSFYLPGSVDVNDQQMEQWNITAPPLYLWSRPDWTAKHKAVALEHGHIITEQEQHPKEAGEHSGCRKGITNYLPEEPQDCYPKISNVLSGYGDINTMLDDIAEGSDDNEHGKTWAFDCHMQEGGLTNYEDVNEAEDMCVDMELSMPDSPFSMLKK